MFDIQNFTVLAADWVFAHGIRMAFILVGAFFVQSFGVHFIEKLIRKLIPRGRGSKEAETKRENTLITVFDGTIIVLVWLVASLTLLSELGVAIGPLLAAAGIVGIAVGFGGQYLIRDIISGLFILIENQYRVGDVVCFDSTCGLVEQISLRMTTLRDLDGTVHHVPHGEIKIVSNLTKGFSRININIGVSYSADIAKVRDVVNRVGTELAADPEWSAHITKPPTFLRIDDFGDSSVIIKILGDTVPIKQWDVAGEFRLRLKLAFDKEGIEIPFPQRVIHQAREV